MTAMPQWTAPTLPSQGEREAIALAVGRMLDQDPDHDGLCDGFRAPDQAIVRLRGPDLDLEDYPISDMFGGGSSVTSNFWAVPLGDVNSALEAIDQAVLQAFPQGCNPEDGDGAITGVWIHPGSDVALVGCIASGDWAASLDETLNEATAYDWERSTWLAFGGNDNGPHNLLDESADDDEFADEDGYQCKILPPSLLDTLYGATLPKMATEALEVWQATRSGVLNGWKPKTRNGPRP